MKLPNLTQLVLLDCGHALALAQAVHGVQDEILTRDPFQGQRMCPVEALVLKPLSRLSRRLLALYERDRGPRPRPRHRLRVEYDELVAVRLLYTRLLATAGEAAERDQLAVALGRLHQPSLNLESHICLDSMNRLGKCNASQVI